MSFVLVTGEIFRAPQLKLSKNGKDYCAATIRSTIGTETEYWSVLAFGDAAQELARLGIGEALSAQGRLQTGTYNKEGEARVSLSIMANSILPLRQPKKPPKPKTPKPADNRHVEPVFDDGLPEGGPWS